MHPDDFLLDQLDRYPGATIAALRAQAASYKSPAMNVEVLLGRLAAAGVPRSRITRGGATFSARRWRLRAVEQTPWVWARNVHP